MQFFKYFAVGTCLFVMSYSMDNNKPTKDELSTVSYESENLIEKAQEVRLNSYSPYSNYKVGAALSTQTGKIYCGTNVENAAYGSTICAERAAICTAISDGAKNIEAIAVVTKDGGSPCGACRQMLNEFNPDMIVILADEKGNVTKKCPLHKLLPMAFGPNNLSK